MTTTLCLTIVVLLLVFCWLLLTEFSYLPGSLVRMLYDHTSEAYEGKWRGRQYQRSEVTNRLFVDPILSAAPHENAKVLDLACGTGRLPLLLLEVDTYSGEILAIDNSKEMLNIFRDKLETLPDDQSSRVSIEQADIPAWNPPPSAFNVVTFLEASEIIPGAPRIIAAAAAAVKPGGFLVLTRMTPWLGWLFPGRCQRRGALRAHLKKCGFDRIEEHAWRWRYDVVHAYKADEPAA